MHYCYHLIALPLVIVLTPAILFELHCAINFVYAIYQVLSLLAIHADHPLIHSTTFLATVMQLKLASFRQSNSTDLKSIAYINYQILT